MDQKHKRFREFRTPFPLRDIRKNPRSNVRACAAGDGAICSKNRKIVPYHGANPNTRNGARLGSPSLIMAPGSIHEAFRPDLYLSHFKIYQYNLKKKLSILFSLVFAAIFVICRAELIYCKRFATMFHAQMFSTAFNLVQHTKQRRPSREKKVLRIETKS